MHIVAIGAVLRRGFIGIECLEDARLALGCHGCIGTIGIREDLHRAPDAITLRETPARRHQSESGFVGRGWIGDWPIPGEGPARPHPVSGDTASGLSTFARETFAELYAQLTELDARIERVTQRVERVSRAHPVCQKLAAGPGIGPLTATALVATVGQPQAFHNGRHLAAWWGWCLGNIRVAARSASAGFRNAAVGLYGRC